jgi:DNA mismatch repair protein MutL
VLFAQGLTVQEARQGGDLAAIACRSAVRLGERLSHEEMEALVREWLSSRHPATCPHGRSICYRLDHKDIARKLDRHWFLRVRSFGHRFIPATPLPYMTRI